MKWVGCIFAASVLIAVLGILQPYPYAQTPSRSMRIAPVLESARTFKGMECTGLGSLDGKVLLLNSESPSGGRRSESVYREDSELVVIDDSGNVVFSAKIQELGMNFAADPGWNHFWFSKLTQETEKQWEEIKIEMGDDAYKSLGNATEDVKIIDRKGVVKYSFQLPASEPFLTDRSVFYCVADLEASGPLMVRELDSGVTNKVGDFYDNLYYLNARGDGFFIDIGPRMLDFKGHVIFSLEGKFDGFREPAMFKDWLVLSREGEWGLLPQTKTWGREPYSYCLIDRTGNIRLEIKDQLLANRALAISPNGEIGVLVIGVKRLYIVDMMRMQVKALIDIGAVGNDIFSLFTPHAPHWSETLDRKHLRVQDGNIFLLGRKNMNGNALLTVLGIDGEEVREFDLGRDVLNAKFTGDGAETFIVWKKNAVERYRIK